MTYETKEVLNMIHAYHKFESESKDFLFLAAFPQKHKEQKVKSAKSTLKSIEEYNKIPKEVRDELEKYQSTNVSKIKEIENICKESISNNS